mmetsp:Transcript_2288/g.5929  ORF Transcript_2288/g.5929 Transcript_2288/m.5929 type:complete len:123 (+) Transcript_2288:212-580(+)
MLLNTKSRPPEKSEVTLIATPKKKANEAWPDGPPLCASTTARAQNTPTLMQAHSGLEMSCFFPWSSDCIKAVESGVHDRMIIVKDSGTRDSERRLRPMFRENDVLKARTSRTSFREVNRLGL